MLKDTMRISGQQEFEIKQKGNIKSYGSSRGKKAELMKKSAKSILKILV